MQIVIEIDEETKATIDTLNDKFDAIKEAFYGSMAIMAIQNGKPLPKGHGDLVTKEQMIELVEFYQINPQHFDFVNLIDEIKDEKPIIEADKPKRKAGTPLEENDSGYNCENWIP